MDAVTSDAPADVGPRNLQSFSRHFAAGARIFEAGAPGRCMYVVLQGAVEIRHAEGDQVAVLNRLEAGECFGEMALLEDGVRTATAVAVIEPTVLIEIDKARFIYLVGQQPAFALTVMRGLSRKVTRGPR